MRQIVLACVGLLFLVSKVSAQPKSIRLTDETIDKQPFEFSVEVTDRFDEGRELRLRVTVRPPRERISLKHSFVGNLTVRDGNVLIVSSPVSSTEEKGRIVYTFLASESFLKNSTFGFGDPFEREYYWFYLGDFAKQRGTPGKDDNEDDDLSGFPELTGTLKQLLGHEQGYVRPRPGEPFRLNLAELADVERLEFDPETESYVPLPGPLAVETVRYFQNGDFANMRLLARAKGPDRVTIDIVPMPGVGKPNYVQVWVIVETEVVRAVSLIDCEAGGTFPSRPK